jgi:apolipoprotein N-acyltransferase
VALLGAGVAQAWALAWPLPFGPTQGEPLPLLQLLALALAVTLWARAPTAWSASGRGWLFATGWLTGTFWWLFVSMHTYGGLPAPLAALAVVALAAALGLYYALAAGLFWRWRRQPLPRRALALAALWTLAEWMRGTWFTGFPWGAVGYPRSLINKIRCPPQHNCRYRW